MKAKLPTSNNLDRFESFFLLGASIYTGTFIIGANVDYRLIFLIFTIPYVLDIKNITIKYGAQVHHSPPIFAFFSNHPNDIPLQYKRYLENRLRDNFGFNGVPIKISFRGNK